MKRHIFTTLTILAVWGMAGQARALPIDDPVYQVTLDYVTGRLAAERGILLDAANPSTGGRFDITSSGPGGGVRIAGDPDGANAYLNAGIRYENIVGFEPGGSEQIVSATAFFYIRGANNQNDLITFDLTGWSPETVEFRGTAVRMIYGGEVAIDILNENGYLDFTITRDSGSFRLDYAQLQVTEVARVSVPDGGATAALLGSALVVLGIAGRRARR
jgi:hypothetical protein